MNLRAVRPYDVGFLWEMLYRASWSHVDDGTTVDSIRDDPDLAPYVEGWGGPGDLGVVACDGPDRVGAAWVRPVACPELDPFPGSDDLLELAIAVVEGHEGRGIGSALLASLLEEVPATPIVLSARSTNPAIALYERHGFTAVGTITNRVGTESVTMLRMPSGSSPDCGLR